MRRVAIIFILLNLICNLSFGIDPIKSDSVKGYQRFDISYVFGWQVYNNNMIYNPGISIQTAYGIMVNEWVGFGLGAGYMALTDERLVPVFFETTGYRKSKASTPYIRMQVGYSFGWYVGPMEAEGYRFRGGVYLDAALGRKFQIKDRYSMSFQISYRHQFARMDYEVFGGESYTEPLNYDLFVITLGLIRF